MGVRKYFSRVGQVDILVVHFRPLTIQMQIDVHITLYYPCYTTKKMTHVTATVQKCASLAAVFLFTLYETLWQQYFFSVFTSYVSFHTVIYCYQQSLHYLPQMSAFNSHMQQNAYCRNLSEPLLPCYCYAIKANLKTILPQVSQPASAGNVADLVNYKLIRESLHDARTVNPALVQCECHTGK